MQYVFTSGHVLVPFESPLLPAFREQAKAFYRKILRPKNFGMRLDAFGEREFKKFLDGMKVGFSPDEGDLVRSRIVWRNEAATLRPAGLDLDLFLNAAPPQNITYGGLSFPTDGGYSTIVLTDGTWTSANPAVYAEQTFTAGTTPTTWTPVQGYATSTKAAPQVILAIEVDGNGPYTFNEGDTYKITQNMTHS